MYQKNCYKCYRPSFSSNHIGEWICPTCGEDLTALKSFHPAITEKVNGRRKDAYRKWKMVESAYNKIN